MEKEKYITHSIVDDFGNFISPRTSSYERILRGGAIIELITAIKIDKLKATNKAVKLDTHFDRLNFLISLETKNKKKGHLFRSNSNFLHNLRENRNWTLHPKDKKKKAKPKAVDMTVLDKIVYDITYEFMFSTMYSKPPENLQYYHGSESMMELLNHLENHFNKIFYSNNENYSSKIKAKESGFVEYNSQQKRKAKDLQEDKKLVIEKIQKEPLSEADKLAVKVDETLKRRALENKNRTKYSRSYSKQEEKLDNLKREQKSQDEKNLTRKALNETAKRDEKRRSTEAFKRNAEEDKILKRKALDKTAKRDAERLALEAAKRKAIEYEEKLKKAEKEGVEAVKTFLNEQEALKKELWEAKKKDIDYRWDKEKKLKEKKDKLLKRVVIIILVILLLVFLYYSF